MTGCWCFDQQWNGWLFQMCLLSGSRAWVLKSVSQTTWIEAVICFDCAPSAKNVVLAGVKSVTIYDPEPVTVQDLSTQAGAFSNDLKVLKPDILVSSFSERKILENPVQRQLCPGLLSWMLMFLYDFFRARLARAYLLILWKDSRYFYTNSNLKSFSLVCFSRLWCYVVYFTANS